MDINKFQQFQKTGVKLGKNIIGIMRSLGFTFSAGFYHRNNVKNYKYVVLFYNPENGRSIGFAFTNSEDVKGKFKLTKSERDTSGSVTCVSFFNNFNLAKNIDEIAGKYEPKETEHPFFDKMYYIKLDEKQTKKYD